MSSELEVDEDDRGRCYQWSLHLAPPPDADRDPLLLTARGRNGWFRPAYIGVVCRRQGYGLDPEAPVMGVAITVRSRVFGRNYPIELYLPREDAVAASHAILAAAGDVGAARDGGILDAIARILDGRVWSPCDDLEAIAEMVRCSGRQIRPPGEVELVEED